MAGTNGKTALLNLNDLAEPGAEWELGTKVYRYVRWSSLGLLERKRIDNRHLRVQAIEEATTGADKEPTEAESAEYELAVREMVGLITVDITTDEIDAMEPEQRAKVVNYFLDLRTLRIGDSQQARIKAMVEAAKILGLLTTENSSSNSTDSGRKKTRASG